MPEETGCQLWGIIGRFLAHHNITQKEYYAIQRRLFAFDEINYKHDITKTDIQQASTWNTLHRLLDQYDPSDLAQMFY
jgi:hypothetical protein